MTARPVLMDGATLFTSAEEAARRINGLPAGVRQAASGIRRSYLGRKFVYVSERDSPKTVAVHVAAGPEGPCLFLDGARVAGAEPSGGCTVVLRIDVAVDALRRELEEIERGKS